MWILWLLLRRIPELAVLSALLFALPENRLETLVVTAAASIWVALKHQQLSSEIANQSRMKFVFQLLRIHYAGLDMAPKPTRQELESDFEGLQSDVGIGDDAILTDRYKYLRAPVSVRTMRQNIEQGWFDSILTHDNASARFAAESAFAILRWLLVAAAAASLL